MEPLKLIILQSLNNCGVFNVLNETDSLLKAIVILAFLKFLILPTLVKDSAVMFSRDVYSRLGYFVYWNFVHS